MNQQRHINTTRTMVEQYRREINLERLLTSTASNDLISSIINEQKNDPLWDMSLQKKGPWQKRTGKHCTTGTTNRNHYN